MRACVVICRLESFLICHYTGGLSVECELTLIDDKLHLALISCGGLILTSVYS